MKSFFLLQALTAGIVAFGAESAPVCRIVYEKDKPYFDIGGTRHETVMYNTTEHWGRGGEKFRKGVEYFRKAGFHLYGLGVETRNVWHEDGSIDFAAAENVIRKGIELDPDGYFMFCISTFRPPKWWMRKHPEELVGYVNGKIDWDEFDTMKFVAVPSFASRLWRREVGDFQKRLVEHLEGTELARRIFAYRADFGVNHEWHCYGMLRNGMPDNGLAMAAAFRRHLREIYADDVEALRKAWHNPTVTFETAAIPGKGLRERAYTIGLRDLENDRSVIDFLRVLSYEQRDCLFASNVMIRRASKGRVPVGNYCGYFFGMEFPAEGWHLDNDRILDSDLVDFQCSPYIYDRENRAPGEPQYARCLLEGLRSRGKLALLESDNSTPAAPWRSGYACPNDEEARLVMARDFFQSIAWGCGMWYFDFGTGWYANPVYEKLFAELMPIRKEISDCRSAAEVLLVGDYESVPLTNIRSPIRQPKVSTTGQAWACGHAGAPFESASFADVASGRLKDYKLYIFLNYHYKTPEKDAVLARLRAAKKGVVTLGNGERIEPAALMKLYRESGVHVWCDDAASVIAANASFLSFHAATPGVRTISLPRTADVEMLYPERKPIAKGVKAFAVSVDAPITACYRLWYNSTK